MQFSIYTMALYQWDGASFNTGGLERYVRDLSFFLKNQGHQVEIFQWAWKDWQRDMDGIPVYGLSMQREGNTAACTQEFHRRAKGRIIYSWLGQQLEYQRESLTICHGIWWDAPNNLKQDIHRVSRAVREVLERVGLCVTVDTNFLNWVRATYPWLADKVLYLPNYVDTQAFFPGNTTETESRDTVKLLFPRRITPERGMELVQRVFPRLLRDYLNLRITFCGSGDLLNEYRNSFQEWLRRQPNGNRIEWVTADFDDMPALYREADVVVIPSPYSEGTSLSCLEAMASGCAVVATNVGGLPNLIIPDFNGLLVHPQADELEEALRRVIENGQLRSSLAAAARQSAEAFDKSIWQRRWLKTLNLVYGLNEVENNG